ncbi:7-methylguanosine phosphate-specific 5'-nucleotidase [Dichanthelium oligosanthes]|uniref:5'-nucleotidase n=1 Tax=Dichanthelium oligosanthes TaxID=888268 RepID=A0A1E5WCA3_9POAL|nr:7-methylguanosine phosphate-specific 5'-nucleotidase [Dichanthelium oligosanthes]
MRPMTSPFLLSPSPCPLLRLLRLYRAPRRRNPTTAPPPPYTFRSRPLLLLHAAMSCSASTAAPDSVVADPSALARKVIADFDGTLTRYWYDGARGQSSHGLLRQGNNEYDAKREALYQHYHPIEICPDIPLPEKAKLMEEWWEKTHGLLIEGGLTYEAIKKSVSDAVIAFRDGVVELFEYLEERDIPVLVFSAGLADIIEEVFRQKLHRSFKNIKVVSNRMVFNEEGRLVAFKGKTIHVLNKNEHALDMSAPVHGNLGDPNESIDDYSLVKKRTNVLLLGDHIGDLGMSDGLNYENRIAVGFLNANIEKSLKDYSKEFDIVYLNDAPMRGVVELVSEICP